MNPDEATQVLAALGAAWPSHDMPSETVRLWIGLLADVDRRDAMAAAKVTVKEDRFYPPISRFLEVCEERAHARRNREAAARGLPRGPQHAAPPERVKVMLADMRAKLDARRGAGGHWHGGPDPCPICGGMATPATRQPHPWGEPDQHHPEESR